MSYGYLSLARALPALAVLTFAAFTAPAFAALGGDEDSVHVDSARFRAQMLSTAMLQYTRHDITTSPDAEIHEYASRSGKVFAVTWRGPLPPDLSQLFGSYFDSYRTALVAQSHPGGHHQLQIVQPDLVIQSVGRLRAFMGKAYVPSLVPAGVDVTELR
jgi:uncharacterized protein DUF2844